MHPFVDLDTRLIQPRSVDPLVSARALLAVVGVDCFLNSFRMGFPSFDQRSGVEVEMSEKCGVIMLELDGWSWKALSSEDVKGGVSV